MHLLAGFVVSRKKEQKAWPFLGPHRFVVVHDKPGVALEHLSILRCAP